MKEIIGYDTSKDEHDLSVLCAECGSDNDGTPIYKGDEWGAFEAPCCSECGVDLSDVQLVYPEPLERS